MPGLQLHQLRVAAVALTVSRAVAEQLDEDAIVAACLLHDMGNIIKFDLLGMALPQFLEPEGQGYWLKIQQDFVAKYGKDEHLASMQIAEEVGVSKYILELIDAIGFNMLATNFKEKNLAKMICEYGDNRVTPLGIVSLEARLRDLENRYRGRHSTQADNLRRQAAQAVARQSEQYIFGLVKIKPSDITDQALDGTIAQLKQYSL